MTSHLTDDEVARVVALAAKAQRLRTFAKASKEAAVQLVTVTNELAEEVLAETDALVELIEERRRRAAALQETITQEDAARERQKGGSRDE
jgi:hypothetical protein